MLCCWGSCHYRCRSALVIQSWTWLFEAQGLYRETVISLTRREPDSQLSPLKIGFLSPEIRIRLPLLHCGSIRKTCRPLRPGEALSAELLVISATFDLQGPVATLIPHQGSFPPRCLSTRRGWPTSSCRCHPFDMVPPPSSSLPRLGRVTITTEEDKGVCVSTERSRHGLPPPMCHLHAHFTDSQTK